jgi:hypothetical protein
VHATVILNIAVIFQPGRTPADTAILSSENATMGALTACRPSETGENTFKISHLSCILDHLAHKLIF